MFKQLYSAQRARSKVILTYFGCKIGRNCVPKPQICIMCTNLLPNLLRHMRGYRFLYFIAKTWAFKDLLLNIPRVTLIFAKQTFSPGICLLPKAVQNLQSRWPKPAQKPWSSKCTWSTLKHGAQPKPQKPLPPSFIDVTRGRGFVLLIQWLTCKHFQEQRPKT